MFYDYADAGSWTEGTYRSNETEFSKIKFRQRVAINIDDRSIASTMLDQPVSMPVALAPVGMTGVRLEVETHLITAGTTSLKNLEKAHAKNISKIVDVWKCQLCKIEKPATVHQKRKKYCKLV